MPSPLVGAAGEHYIMYRLLRMNQIAAATPKGAPNADIIVSSVDGSRTAVLQVKTRRELGTDKGWHMKSKHEELVSDQLFYCFVDLGPEQSQEPVVYVIPSKIVADILKESHRIWLATPGRNGRAHQPTEMRRLLPDYKMHKLKYEPGWMEHYKENWNLLNLH